MKTTLALLGFAVFLVACSMVYINEGASNPRCVINCDADAASPPASAASQ